MNESCSSVHNIEVWDLEDAEIEVWNKYENLISDFREKLLELRGILENNLKSFFFLIFAEIIHNIY